MTHPVMHWRGRVLTADTPILERPPHGQRHWDADTSDRLSTWRTVPKGASFDGNVYPACGEIWFMHTGRPGPDGYDWVIDAKTGKRREMTSREKRRPASRWGKAGIHRWRDRRGQSPMTLEEGLTWCVRNQRLCAIEPKGPSWGRTAWAFARLREVCERTGHPAWVKRLVQLRVPKATVIQAHRNDVQVAAICGKRVRGRARRKALVLKTQRGWGKVRFDAVW